MSNLNQHSSKRNEQWLYCTRISLYLVRLKTFEWIKLLRRHLPQKVEMNLNSIQLSNNIFPNGIFGGTLDLG